MCGFVAKTKYSIKRHIDRKHIESETELPSNTSVGVESSANVSGNHSYFTLSDALLSVGLEDLKIVFETAKNDFDMLLDLRDEEMMDMFKNIGIVSWGICNKF